MHDLRTEAAGRDGLAGGIRDHQRRDRGRDVAHGDHGVVGAEVEVQRRVDHDRVAARDDGLHLHAGALGDGHETRTVGVVDVGERHGAVHEDVDGRRVRRRVQRAQARRGRALQELGGGHFGRVEDVVAVRVETALEYEAAARAVGIALRQRAGRDQRIEAVGTRHAILSIPPSSPSQPVRKTAVARIGAASRVRFIGILLTSVETTRAGWSRRSEAGVSGA